MKNPICGKVAKILNSRELALNIGKNQGVQLDMKFDVIDKVGEDIRDPDTNKTIGSVERSKVRVTIVSVQENLSVASTYKKCRINKGGGNASFHSVSQMFMPPKWVVEHETLKTSESTWEDLPESASYVKTGDKVIQVISDDSEE